MNTYRAVEMGPGRWGVEWVRDGVSQGILFSTYESKREALYYVMLLAVTEAQRLKLP